MLECVYVCVRARRLCKRVTCVDVMAAAMQRCSHQSTCKQTGKKYGKHSWSVSLLPDSSSPCSTVAVSVLICLFVQLMPLKACEEVSGKFAPSFFAMGKKNGNIAMLRFTENIFADSYSTVKHGSRKLFSYTLHCAAAVNFKSSLPSNP